MSDFDRHGADIAPVLKRAVGQPHIGLISPSQIMGSKTGLNVTIMVFGVVFLIQVAVCIVMMHVYELEQLAGLREIARTALVQAIQNTSEQPASTFPFQQQDISRLLTHGVIEGLAVYDAGYARIKNYGVVPLTLDLGLKRKNHDNYRSFNGFHYEVTFTPNEIGHPYNIVARLNARYVTQRIAIHTVQVLRIFFLMSLFITGVLMLAMMSLPLAPALRRKDDIIKKLHSQTEDRVRRLAYFDSLTGLPNRTYFLDNLEETIKNRVQGSNEILAVLAVDLDHFKDINDTMGHEVGDKVIEIIAQRLVHSLPGNAVVARSSADEFVVMVPLAADQQNSSALAEKITASLHEPVEVMQENFLIRASIGVSHYPQDGDEARHILKNTDIALNRAKAEGRNTVCYYSKDFELIVQQRVQMLRDLRTAMEQKQLQLHYHPQFDLRTGQMAGVEALLRWWRPDNSKEGGKFIPPVEFIPVAEQSGLIVPIGEWVLRTACATAKKWQDKGLPPIRMAVNISGIQFHRSDIVSLVADVLKKTRLDPQWLELELTESVFIKDIQAAIEILDQLHQQGVYLAIDDFGTGYSSLSYLRQFPIDRLKIDQSFIRTSLLNTNDRMITRAIINLGHSLNLRVIAEGVETKDHEDLLKEEGCDEAQGFKYSKPIPADKFWDFAVAYNESLVKNGKTGTAE